MWSDAPFPEQLAAGRGKTIDGTVVRAEVDFAIGDGGGESNGALGLE